MPDSSGESELLVFRGGIIKSDLLGVFNFDLRKRSIWDYKKGPLTLSSSLAEPVHGINVLLVVIFHISHRFCSCDLTIKAWGIPLPIQGHSSKGSCCSHGPIYWELIFQYQVFVSYICPSRGQRSHCFPLK